MGNQIILSGIVKISKVGEACTGYKKNNKILAFKTRERQIFLLDS